MMDFQYTLDRPAMITAIYALSQMVRDLSEGSADKGLARDSQALFENIVQRWGKEVDGFVDSSMHRLADDGDKERADD